MRGPSILPDAPKRWRPKTRAAALAALEESRRYAARLEAVAREQETLERELRVELDKLRAGVVTGRKELTDTKDSLARAEKQKNEKAKENYKRKRQTERLIDRLKRTEREVSRKEKALDQARADLAVLRRQHEHQTAEQTSQLADARAEATKLSESRDELAAKVQKLTETTDQLEQRATDAEHKLKQRDEELHRERKDIDEAKRGREESQAHIELLQRRLEAEQERRTEAEQQIEQLRKEHAATGQSTSPRVPAVGPPTRLGRYHDFAALMNYDPSSDELFTFMTQEVLISARYSDWQERHMQRVTARRRDPAQTLEEQAFAAMMALRWRLIDHPHIRQVASTAWARLGVLMIKRDERYAAMLTHERISEMKARMAAAD